MKMPFGKHKGTELEDIPQLYLKWMSENVKLHGALLSETTRILAGRPKTRPLRPDSDSKPSSPFIDAIESFEDFETQLKRIQDEMNAGGRN